MSPLLLKVVPTAPLVSACPTTLEQPIDTGESYPHRFGAEAEGTANA